MISELVNRLKVEKEDYKHRAEQNRSYFYLALLCIYVIVTILFVAIVDAHKLKKMYDKSQADLVQMTAKTAEQQILLAENEELLRINYELKKVLP